MGGSDQGKEGLLEQTSTGSYMRLVRTQSDRGWQLWLQGWLLPRQTHLGSCYRPGHGRVKNGHERMFWNKDLPVLELTLHVSVARMEICALLTHSFPILPHPTGDLVLPGTETFSLTMLVLLSNNLQGRPPRSKSSHVSWLSIIKYW